MIHADICADCAVRDRALCGSLSDEELQALNSLGRKRHVAAGETIVWAGDDSLICANLLSGVLRLDAAMADGREQVVGLLYPADFVGRVYADIVEFTITAITDAELCVFPRASFEAVLQDHVRMERLLLKRTLATLDESRRRMLTLSRASALEKVGGLLLDLAARAAGTGCRATADGPITFDLPLSRGQIADILGLTIETVSRQMTALKAGGIISLPGGRGITIVDAAALRSQSEPA